jgi:hypothetical protein
VFGGSFADGGTVPGPMGAPRMILAHGGETVTPASGTPPFVVLVEDGAVDGRRIRVIAGDEAENRLRRASRSGGRPLPGRGGGIAVG